MLRLRNVGLNFRGRWPEGFGASLDRGACTGCRYVEGRWRMWEPGGETFVGVGVVARGGGGAMLPDGEVVGRADVVAVAVAVAGVGVAWNGTSRS